jgi:hypothetical protein
MKKVQFETLEELIAKRKGYKYLNKDGTSPHQGYKYNLRKKKFVCDSLDEDTSRDCAAGWNLATLQWISNDKQIMDKIIVEFSIPPEAKIIVPKNSSGKFRTDIIIKERVWKPKDLFPVISKVLNRLKKYKPINPITATEMPDVKKIKKVWDQVRDQVWDQVREQVRDQVWDQVREQVWDQVWEQVWDQVWGQVWDQVWEQAGAQVWAQVREQAGAQVGDQVREQAGAQVGVIAYYAIKLFMKLDYEHPVFDLARMGIIVVKVAKKLKVFGKAGKYLGEIDI